MASFLSPCHSQDQPVPLNTVLHIDADQKKATVSPLFYGLMTEEINHSYDGGLYAELVQNRIFRDDPYKPVHWLLVQDNGGTGSMSLDQSQQINPYLTTCLRLDAKSIDENQRVGIANDGFWGVPLRPRTDYHFFCFAKGEGIRGLDYKGKLTVSLENSDGSVVYAQAIIPSISKDWKGYPLTLTTGTMKPTADARLVIAAELTGKIWFNLVSLFPPTWNNRANGNRVDLMQRLSDLKPAFLRFPGGNYLEGDDPGSRFDWKRTIHTLNTRPGHMGPWGYRSSDGLGLMEFMLWCEELHMQPVLAVYAGFSLKRPAIKPGGDLQPFVREALDEIEYLTGDTSTFWGEQRAADGHPAPFSLLYVEIGNEDGGDRSHSYDERFTQFYDQIKEKYPQIKLIATTKVKSRIPDIEDEHFYRSPDAMIALSHRFDSYDRKGPRIMVGEWSTTEGNPTPTFRAALADAIWWLGLERNADLIVMQAYAPLLVNVNHGAQQWSTNLIGFDALSSYVSPSYHVQKLFNECLGDAVLQTSIEGASQLPYSVTRDSTKNLIYVKVVNTRNTPQTMQIEISGAKVDKLGKSILLRSSSLDRVNSLSEPSAVAPEFSVEKNFSESFTYSFPPESISILILTED